LKQPKHQIHSGNRIADIKQKRLREKPIKKSFSYHLEPPPHLKKRNRRFKSIYEAMHMGDQRKPRNNMYGVNREYQKFISRNEIPDDDYIKQLLMEPLEPFGRGHMHYEKQLHNRSHQRIKKLRSKPEAGIMQKKLRVNRN
jgi:hypothetical protein